MKKIIAILLVISILFAFAACKNDENIDPTETNTLSTTEDQAVNSGDVDVEPESSTDENTSDEESTTGDVADEPSSDKSDKEDETQKDDKDDETESTTKKPVSDNPAEWSKAEIVEAYKNAAIKTHSTAKSSQTMVLNKLVVNDGDGALNFFINMLKPVIDTALKNNTTSYNGLTGGFTKLVASDVKSAKAYKQGNYTVIEMTMNEQTDGLYGDAQEGSVGHAINVLGNVADAVEQFPDFDIKYKEADIKVHYVQPTVKVKINDNGKIEKGTWRYVSDIYIRHLDISGIMIDKADAQIEYVIVVGGGF
jgi:cytoskeletal protein RodZ